MAVTAKDTFSKVNITVRNIYLIFWLSVFKSRKYSKYHSCVFLTVHWTKEQMSEVRSMNFDLVKETFSSLTSKYP